MCNASSLATKHAFCPSPTLCLKGILVKASLPGSMDCTALPGMGLHRWSTVFSSISPAPPAVWLEPHWLFGYFPNMPGPHPSQGLETLSHITGFCPPYLFPTFPHLSRPTEILSSSVFSNFSGQRNFLSSFHYNGICWNFIPVYWFDVFPLEDCDAWWQGASSHPAPSTALHLAIAQQIRFQCGE